MVTVGKFPFCYGVIVSGRWIAEDGEQHLSLVHSYTESTFIQFTPVCNRMGTLSGSLLDAILKIETTTFGMLLSMDNSTTIH